MNAAATASRARDQLVERLVGDSAEPDKVVSAARAIGERAIPAIVKTLGEMSGTAMDVGIEAVELGRIADVFASESESEPLAVAASAHSPDALMLTMDSRSVSLMTGLLFGAGPEIEPVAIERTLSAIERQVASGMFTRLAESLNGSGSRAMQVRFPLPAPIMGEDRRKQAYRDGPSARIVYRISIPGGSGLMAVTMPQRVVLTRRGDEGGPEQGSDWQSRLGGEVMRSRVRVEATVSLGRLTLGEIANLVPGQLLTLPAAAPGNTKLSSRGKTLFVCEFGKLGQNYTVRVKEAFDPEQDLIDGLIHG